MARRELRDGRQDGLTPLESLDPERIDSFAQLLRAMSRTAFGGRRLGDAFEVLTEMFRRPDVTVVLTVSGAMTVAKQGRILCQLVERGLVQVVVATGALIAHGLTESIGRTHYRRDNAGSDEQLYQHGYNRIYDTLEMEANLDDVEALVRDVLDRRPPSGGWSSAALCRELGAELDRRGAGPGILRAAHRRGVPVFIPALTDSELGLDMATWAMERRADQQRRAGRPPSAVSELLDAAPPFNPFLDLQQYARVAAGAQRLGIFTIGGGVPRNWAQQIGPYFDVATSRLGLPAPTPRFQYGVRICPEPDYWGGLSGCTYAEGVSWGKFVPPSEGGRFAEVLADATLVLPLLAKAVFETLDAEADEDR